MFISLMTGQTETTEIKMNMRNINIITARSVPDKSVSDDFMNAVLSNGFNTDQMLKQLGNLNPQQFMSGSQGGGNDGK